jgi:hypothetical protein
MFYNQPLAHRFGTALGSDIESEKWNRIKIAVAWVRRSGTQHLEPSFKKFLGRGCFAQITVGVDIENASAEGLKDFLDLQTAGNIETHIHHNEAATTFHPKVYLLRNDADARLIVGSNNLTGAGLSAFPISDFSMSAFQHFLPSPLASFPSLRLCVKQNDKNHQWFDKLG